MAQPAPYEDTTCGSSGIDLDLLTPAERRDLANALLRAAWSAALEDTRILLLDLFLAVDDTIVGDGRRAG